MYLLICSEIACVERWVDELEISQYLPGNYAQFERGIMSGTKWNSDFIPYSFPAKNADHVTPYGGRPGADGEGEWRSQSPLNPQERAAVKIALNKWGTVDGKEGAAKIKFGHVDDAREDVDAAHFSGILRFSLTKETAGNVPPGKVETGHAYEPGFETNPWTANVWLNSDHWHKKGDALGPGTRPFVTLMHEIGHAIGLKHPFEGGFRLDPGYDSYSYTVMSYNPSADSSVKRADFYPTTPMYIDLAAIQDIYGRSTQHSGNNSYAYHQGKHYWETIDDSGGVDAIVYTGTKGVTIDLAIGHWSKLGKAIHFNNGTSQANTVMIGPRSDIENALGGSGRDVLIGNDANASSGFSGANELNGRGGNDSITGSGGDDTLKGGKGMDVLAGGAGMDTLYGGGALDLFYFASATDSAAGAGRDQILDFNRAQHDKIDISKIGTSAGVQFSFIGANNFHGVAGEIRFANNLVQVDINGNGAAEFEIYVNVTRLVADDFLL